MPNWVDNVVILDFTKASDKAKQYLERLLAYEQPESRRHEDERPGLFGMFIPVPEVLAVPEVLDGLKVKGNSRAKAMPDWYNSSSSQVLVIILLASLDAKTIETQAACGFSLAIL